jgi:hypothetical protein
MPFLSRLFLALSMLMTMFSHGATAQDVLRWEHLAGAWVIESRNERVLGTINLYVDEGISGEGRLRDGRDILVVSRTLGGREIVFDVIHGIGDTSPGTLTLTEDAVEGTQFAGTYETGNRRLQVRLVPSLVQDIGMDDLPGVGLSGPPYRLRNAPGDGWVRVHREPRVISDRFDMRIWKGEEDILVLDCDPWIEAHVVEAADFAARLRMLDGLWCRIEHTDAGGIVTLGWLPGTNLEPMRERM